MSDASSTKHSPPAGASEQRRADRGARWYGSHGWIPYVLPIATFMFVGSFEPLPPPESGAPAEPALLSRWFAIDYRAYPIVYGVKIVLVAAAIAAAWPMLRQWPWRVGRWAAPLGVLGGFVWIALCKLDLEPRLYGLIGLESWAESERSAYDPFVQLAGRPLLASAFAALRGVGLVLLVPIAEEFFLRGFLARWVIHATWQEAPFGQLNAAALATLTIVPLLTHPSEGVAALVWFSAINVLMVRTRSIWDCVVAHAATNLTLGAYAVATGDWTLL